VGNGPFRYDWPADSKIGAHIHLVKLLRSEICERAGKTLIYRTWSFDGFHTDPEFYQTVTDHIEPHDKLIFSIKHTAGDFWRTRGFNQTLTEGQHKQIVEVQCQREYEGKGAHPQYIARGVIEGFEEYADDGKPKGLAHIKDHPNFAGVWTWSRGGGWRGPYIENELWCDQNVWVMAQWTQNPNKSEEEIFNAYMDKLGIQGKDRELFRFLSLESARGILRGHYSTFYTPNVVWTRDHYLGGYPQLEKVFSMLTEQDLVERALAEKDSAAAIWGRIADMGENIGLADKETEACLHTSAAYGKYKYAIIAAGWNIMLRAHGKEKLTSEEQEKIKPYIEKYDRLWAAWRAWKKEHPEAATLYKPGYIKFMGDYKIKDVPGMDASVDKVRKMIN
jgi:hypothetical protein